VQQVSSRIIDRIKGPAWDLIRPVVLQVSESLLSVSPAAYAELTTIYAKFTLTSQPSSNVFAVMWLKSSKVITIGLALPKDTTAPELGPAPKGMTYRGLTKYFALKPDGPIPTSLSQWAEMAFKNVTDAADE
jgi:hypothetical protein